MAMVEEKDIIIASVKDWNNPHKLEISSDNNSNNNCCSSMVWTKDINQVLITNHRTSDDKDDNTTNNKLALIKWKNVNQIETNFFE